MDDEKNPFDDFFLDKDSKENKPVEKSDEIKKVSGETPYRQEYFSELDRSKETSENSSEGENSEKEDFYDEDEFEE